MSYSQLRRYRTCPRQFEFSNIKKIPWGISEGESFGASVHNALKRWGELELELAQGERTKDKGQRTKGKGIGQGVREDQLILFHEEKKPADSALSVEKLLEIWHETFVFDTYKTRFEADFARSRGEALMHQFFLWWSQVPRSVGAVEKSFSLTIDGTAIAGRLDRIEQTEQGVRIVDYKTTAPCTQAEADADLQLSLYALAAEHLFDQPCSELLLLFLSNEGITERTTVRSASQLKDARTQIRLIRERMEAKDFRPTPSVPACKRCPYHGICDVAAV
ncbi:MAG: PD-(D/E)XK nuclease family protein [Candidatus Peregrinibacteria bacterium]